MLQKCDSCGTAWDAKEELPCPRCDQRKLDHEAVALTREIQEAERPNDPILSISAEYENWKAKK